MFNRLLHRNGFITLIVVAGLTATILAPVLPQDSKLVWFALANFGITLGYFYIATTVVPYFDVDRNTKLAAIVFFATCATTHIELGAHALWGDGLPLVDLASWHMLIIHTIQVASIWRFVWGLRKSAIIERERLNELVEEERNGV